NIRLAKRDPTLPGDEILDMLSSPEVKEKVDFAELFEPLTRWEQVIIKMRIGMGTENEKVYTLEEVRSLFKKRKQFVLEATENARRKVAEKMVNDEYMSGEGTFFEENNNDIFFVESIKICPD